MARPKGSKTQRIEVPGSPWVYLKPFQRNARWVVRRRHLFDGRVEQISLPDAVTFEDAYRMACERALSNGDEAELGRMDPADRPLVDVTFGKAWEQFLVRV